MPLVPAERPAELGYVATVFGVATLAVEPVSAWPWAWVVGQRRVWLDRFGREHEIAEMDVGYVLNVLAFCRARAAQIQALAAAERVVEGELGLESLLMVLAADAGGWLEATPLLAALRARAAARAGEAAAGG